MPEAPRERRPGRGFERRVRDPIPHAGGIEEEVEAIRARSPARPPESGAFHPWKHEGHEKWEGARNPPPPEKGSD